MEAGTTSRTRDEGARSTAALAQAGFVSLQRTAYALMHGVTRVLEPYDLTPNQYNVLRILRGAAEPLTCGQVAERMIARDPDVTRMLDRLEKRGLVHRERSTEDRRVVVTEILQEGLDVLVELDEPVERIHAEQLGSLGAEKLETLLDLLEEARAGAG